MNRNRFMFLVVLLLLVAVVPSIDAQQNTAGYYYYANGQIINLQVSNEWVAVRLGRGRTAANTPSLTTISGIGDVSQALEIDSPRVTLLPLASGSSMAATASAIQRNTTLSVEWANPVFTYGDAEYFVSDQFMAAFPANMTEAQIDAYNAQYGVQRVQRMLNSLENLYLLQVTAASGRNALDMANVYQTGGVALYSTPNFGRLYNRGPQRNFVPNDGLFASQWHLNNTAQYIGATADADIDAPEAWEYTQGDTNVIVAFLDDGMQLNHPDLSSKYVFPYDPAQGDTNPTPTTAVELANDAHGTNVGGLIGAATNNTTGVSGVCPNCRIMPIRIGYSISNTFWYVPSNAIVNGFDWARTNGAAVISNSWSGGLPDTAITNAITNAINLGRGGLGAVVTFAAGNDQDQPVDFPSNLSNVMTIGATNWCDQRKSTQSTSCNDYPYEVWGNNTGSSLDVAAPGMDLYSTDLTGTNGYWTTDYYPYMNGTSGATPIVSGVLGLVISENPNLTGAEARQVVEYTTDDVIYGSGTTAGWDAISGWGRVNAYRAVQLARYLETAPTAPVSPVLGDHPTLTWPDFGPADYWYVEVRNANTNVVVAGQWFTLAQAGCNLVICSGQISTALAGGIPYKYRVSPFDNAAGRGSSLFTPFSGTFTIASPVLTGPTGTVSASYGNPTYTWTGLSGATHYYLIVNNSANQVVINEVFDAIVACSGLNCSLDPTTLRESNRLLTNGTYYYWVRAWSQSSGTSGLSAPGTFTLNAPAPSAPTLNMPSGLGTLRPTFDFNSPDGATWLNVWVTNASGSTTIFDQWFTRTQACGSPTSTVCQAIQSPVTLADNTQYRYYVRGYGPGGMGSWSTALNFTVNPLPPADPTGMNLTLLPNGLVQTQWTDDLNSSWYMVRVSSLTGTVIFNQWMQRSTANLCNAGTCTLNLTNHFPSGATYRLDMQAYGDGGITALTNGPTLAINLAAPAAVTSGFSPTGVITNDRPTYQWNEVANASYYQLVSTAAGSGWYRADTICTGGVCRVPLTSSLANGSYQWRVQTFGPGGLGPLSASQSFSLGYVGAPAAPTLVSPGTFTTAYPTLSWSRDANITYYHLLIVSPSATVKDVWYHVSQICDAFNCTIQFLDTALANGNYTWYMQGYNPAGLGGWGTTTFAVSVTAPIAPSLDSPTGGSILVTNRPTFTWNTAANTAWYNIEITNSLGAVALTQWIQATTCAATCVFQPTTVLPYGIYTWRVRGWNTTGTGSFSSALLFYALSTNTVPMMVESNDGVMRNPGNWSAIQDANALGGSYAGNAAGTSDWMTLTFNGTGIDVVYIGGPSFGAFNVELDGHVYQTVNSSYAETHYGLAVQIQGLAAGEHILRIMPVNGSSVAIDAFYIAGGFVFGGERPTLEPTAVATEAPTAVPTEAPTEVPTEAPTEVPTETPTEIPTEVPTETPTEVPTETPVP